MLVIKLIYSSTFYNCLIYNIKIKIGRGDFLAPSLSVKVSSNYFALDLK